MGHKKNRVFFVMTGSLGSLGPKEVKALRKKLSDGEFRPLEALPIGAGSMRGSRRHHHPHQAPQDYLQRWLRRAPLQPQHGHLQPILSHELGRGFFGDESGEDEAVDSSRWKTGSWGEDGPP